jgi:hypothetical protein
VGNWLKVSAREAAGDRLGKGKAVTCLAEQVLPLATPTRLVEGRRIGKFAAARSRSLM